MLPSRALARGDELHVDLELVTGLWLRVARPPVLVAPIALRGRQPAHAQAPQDPPDAGLTERDLVGALHGHRDLQRPEVVVLAQVHDRADDLGARGPRAPAAPGRAVPQACFAELVVAPFPAVEAGSRNAVLPAGLRDVAADFLSVPQDRQAVRRGSRELSFGHLDSLLVFGAQYHRPLSVLELDERRVRDWAVVRGVYLGLPFTPARMTRSLANSPWFGNSSKPDETSRTGTLNSGRHAYR